MNTEMNGGADLDLSGVFAGVSVKDVVVAVTDQLKTQPQRRGKQTLIFDIETIPDESRLDKFGLDPLPIPKQREAFADCPACAEVVAKSIDEIKKLLRERNPDDTWLDELGKFEQQGGKKRKGVFDAIEEIRQQDAGIEAAKAERNKLLSVTPEFCRVIAIGTARGTEEVKTRVVGIGGCDESMLLEWFWDLIDANGPLVGFNILGFDIPVILVRSAILGIRPSRRIDLKPWGNDCIDLMAIRWPRGGQKGLKDLARILGLAVPAEGVDGSQVYEFWQAGKLAEIAAYQASDIEVTRKLYEMWRGYFF